MVGKKLLISSKNKNMLEKIIPDSEGKKLNVLGDNQLIKLTGLDTNGQLTVVTQLKPASLFFLQALKICLKN